MHQSKLREILESHEDAVLFPCIADLVENGIKVDRFSSQESVPSRQDVTQFLATWFRYINVAAKECQDWMIDYCTSELSLISSSSKSQIRHSTKSNIKYVYRSSVEFNCGRTENIFKAACNSNCKVYNEMVQKNEKNSHSSLNKLDADNVENNVEPVISLKKQYKEQFIEATEIMRHHYENNLAKKEMVKILNDRGVKTRTGKSWTIGILGHELKNIKK